MKRLQKRKHLSNQGFSLIELVITMLISGVVVAAVAAFLTLGTRMFYSMDAETMLQSESQIAELFLTELFQESDNYEVIDDTTYPSDVTFAVKVLRNGVTSVVIVKENELWYGNNIADGEGGAMIADVKDLGKSGAFLASQVESLSISPTSHTAAVLNEQGLVKMDFTFKADTREYTESAFISLRNKVRN